jgi:hypothetical protein
VVKHAFAALLLIGCVKQAQQVMGPDPDATGAFSCREIVESCDSECTDPICVNKCTEQGTREAQPQHAALVDCAQRNSCMDRNCMEANCPQEIQTCMGEPSEPPSGDTPVQQESQQVPPE